MSLNTLESQLLVECYSQLKGANIYAGYGLWGKEGNRTSYTVKMTFLQLAEQFNLVPSGVLPETVKLQRDLVSSRTSKIKQYIKDNTDFVFPAVIAVVESLDVEKLDFSDIVKITLNPDSFRYLVDGQGRLSAIKEIVNELPELGNNTIDVKFIISTGLASDAQLFSDINTTPIRPNRSQCVAMDSRSVLNSFAKRLVQSSPILSDKICYSKASVTTSSTDEKLWTLNQVTAFILTITGLTAKAAEESINEERIAYWSGFINAYFSQLKHSDAINDALSGNKPPAQIRKETIIGTSVMFKSLALFGKIIMLNFIERGQTKADWSFMEKLKHVDFSYSNPQWKGRCMNQQGRLEDKSFNHRAVASYLCDVVGLQKPDDVISAENDVIQSRLQLDLEVNIDAAA